MMAQDNRKATGKRAVTPEVAFDRLVALGRDASIPMLRQALRNEFGDDDVPPLDTMYGWRKRYNWPKRLEEAAKREDKRVDQLVINDAAKFRATQVKQLQSVSQEAARITMEILAEADEAFKQTARTPANLKRLIDLAVAASTHAELLEGRATERHDFRVLQDDMDDEALIERWKAKLQEQREDSDERTGPGGAGGPAPAASSSGSSQLH
jgi:hypothetical protein